MKFNQVMESPLVKSSQWRLPSLFFSFRHFYKRSWLKGCHRDHSLLENSTQYLHKAFCSYQNFPNTPLIHVICEAHKTLLHSAIIFIFYDSLSAVYDSLFDPISLVFNKPLYQCKICGGREFGIYYTLVPMDSMIEKLGLKSIMKVCMVSMKSHNNPWSICLGYSFIYFLNWLQQLEQFQAAYIMHSWKIVWALEISQTSN